MANVVTISRKQLRKHWKLVDRLLAQGFAVRVAR